jgi:hypothetical protein
VEQITSVSRLYLLPSSDTVVMGDAAVLELQRRPDLTRYGFIKGTFVSQNIFSDYGSRDTFRNVGNWLHTDTAHHPRRLHCIRFDFFFIHSTSA